MSLARYRKAVKESKSKKWWNASYTRKLKAEATQELKKVRSEIQLEVEKAAKAPVEDSEEPVLFTKAMLMRDLGASFRSALSYRLRHRDITNNCSIEIFVPASYYFAVVWPYMESCKAEAGISQRHYGYWNKPNYKHVVKFEVSSRGMLDDIFGTGTSEPVTWGMMSKEDYNDDPTKGALRGGHSQLKLNADSPGILSVPNLKLDLNNSGGGVGGERAQKD